MAGDWIKMRRGLRHDPKVIAIARHLSARRDFMNWWSDPVRVTCHANVTEIVTFANVTRVTVCALLDVWAALNETVKMDGVAPFMVLQDIDDIAEIPGFGEAMESVGWVRVLESEGLGFPNFGEHNTPARERTREPKTPAQRAKEYRDRKKAESDRHGVTSRHEREEKRREEKNKDNEEEREARTGVPTLRDDSRQNPVDAGQGFSRETVLATCGAQGIPPEVGEKFFLSMESVGWIDAKGRSIRNLSSALSGYWMTWRANDNRTKLNGNQHNADPIRNQDYYKDGF